MCIRVLYESPVYLMRTKDICESFSISLVIQIKAHCILNAVLLCFLHSTLSGSTKCRLYLHRGRIPTIKEDWGWMDEGMTRVSVLHDLHPIMVADSQIDFAW